LEFPTMSCSFWSHLKSYLPLGMRSLGFSNNSSHLKSYSPLGTLPTERFLTPWSHFKSYFLLEFDSRFPSRVTRSHLNRYSSAGTLPTELLSNNLKPFKELFISTLSKIGAILRVTHLLETSYKMLLNIWSYFKSYSTLGMRSLDPLVWAIYRVTHLLGYFPTRCYLTPWSLLKRYSPPGTIPTRCFQHLSYLKSYFLLGCDPLSYF